jgi:hypothetical protein
VENIQNTIFLGREKNLSITTRVLPAITPYITVRTRQDRDPVWGKDLIRSLKVMTPSVLDHIVFVQLSHMMMMNTCTLTRDGRKWQVVVVARASPHPHRNHPVRPLNYLESGAATKWRSTAIRSPR